MKDFFDFMAHYIVEITKTILEYETRIQDMDKEIAQLRKDNAEPSQLALVIGLRQQVERAASRNTKLEESVALWKRWAKASIRRNSKLRDEVARWKRWSETMRSRVAKLRDDLQQSGKRIIDLGNENTALNLRIERLRECVTDRWEKHVILSKRVKKYNRWLHISLKNSSSKTGRIKYLAEDFIKDAAIAKMNRIIELHKKEAYRFACSAKWSEWCETRELLGEKLRDLEQETLKDFSERIAWCWKP